MSGHVALVLLVCVALGTVNGKIVLGPLPFSASQSLRSVMTHQVNSLRVPMPSRTHCPTCLVKSFVSAPKIHAGTLARAQLSGYFRSYPQEIQRKMQMLVYAQSTVFHGFSYAVKVDTRSGRYYTYVGAARRRGEVVQFGILHTEVRGVLVQKTTAIHHRRCKRRWWKKRCRTSIQHVPRGYTGQELNNIERAFRHTAVNAIASKLKSVPFYTLQQRRRRSLAVFQDLDDDLEIEDLDEPVPMEMIEEEQSSTELLKRKVKRYLKKYDEIKKNMESESKDVSQVIQRITSNGVGMIAQSASMHTMTGINKMVMDRFSQIIMNMLEIPEDKRADLKSAIFDKLPEAPPSDWLKYRMLFSVDNSTETKYICLLAHNNGESYDFAIADIKRRFELAPDILVVERKTSDEWGLEKSEIIIKKVPKKSQLTKKDLDLLMTFFDLAAFKRFAELLNLQKGVFSDGQEQPDYLAAIKAGLDLWRKFANAFKTKITRTIVKEIVGEGFSHFTSESVAQTIIGMRPDFLNRYTQLFNTIYNIPKEHQEKVSDVLQLVQWTNKHTWQKNDMMFAIDQGGSSRWIMVLFSKNPDGTYNFLVGNVKQTFKLAPTILVIKESKSVLGGIYGSEKYKLKRIPRALTEKDVEQLTAFFNIVTFKRFAMSAGVKQTQPDPKIIT